MPKPFKNLPSLLKYLETAPLKTIRLLFDHLASSNDFKALKELPWPSAGEDLTEDHRQPIKDACADLPERVGALLDINATKILKLSEDKAGTEAIRTVEDSIYLLDTEELSVTTLFAAQPDALGRITVLFALAPKLFKKAELFFHSEYYRNFGKLYDAFDIDSDGTPEIKWDDEIRSRLEEAVRSRLAIAGDCLIEHVPVDRKADDGATIQEHIFLIRHAGDRSSVQNTKTDLSTEPLYYTPPVEHTIVVQPNTRSIEVLCEDRSARAALANAFAHEVLESPLSERPVTLRQYNLKRFYASLALDQEGMDELGVNDVRVVEAEARPENFGRRVIIKVNKDDDIEQALHDIFGGSSIFRGRTSTISRIVLNIQFFNDDKLINLPIALTYPNRCNLGGRKDPQERSIGAKVLQHYGILTPVAQLQDGDEARVIDSLLKLFESDLAEVRLPQLQAWGADIALLQVGGFLTPKGRATDISVTDDDGNTHVREVRPHGQRLVTIHPVTHAAEEVDPDNLVRYDVQRRWVLESISKALTGALKSSPTRRQAEPVTDLGEMEIDEHAVPLSLAKQLHNDKHRNNVEVHLRGQPQANYGIVFTATDTYDEYLGPNVVIGLREVMIIADNEIQMNVEQIRQIWRTRRHRASTVETVELRRSMQNPDGYATLHIPGKDPWSVSGEKQILVIQRLVDAYHADAQILQAGELFHDMPSNNPNQLFGKDKTWEQYIGHPAGR